MAVKVLGVTLPRLVAAPLIAVLLALAIAETADARTYRSPGYRGTRDIPATLPPAAPTPIAIGTGFRPDVLVDAAGTGHIVWGDGRGDDQDALSYCRLRRGGPACELRHDLVPDQGPFAPGEGPEFNVDVHTPRVLAVGDQLTALTHRYPHVRPTPDGETEDDNTYLFQSIDGGSGFSPPALVGNGDLDGQPVVFGPPDALRIGLISGFRTGGAMFQEIAGGRYTRQQVNLGVDGVQGSLARTGANSVTAAFAHISGIVHVRTWNGAGDIYDANNWTDLTFPGTDPKVASGPSGLFVMNRDPDGIWAVRRIDGGAVGPRIAVSTPRDGGIGDFYQDASGRLFAAYRATTDSGDQLVVRVSQDGRTFGRPLPLTPVGTVPTIYRLTAAQDGGGFAIAQIGSGSADPIQAIPFGNQGPTNQAGLGGLRGGAADPDVVEECQRIRFGVISIRAQEGCLLGVEGNARLRVSEGPIMMNGLEIVPEGNTKILINARARTIDTDGNVRVQMRAPGIPPVLLYRGELHINPAREAAAQRQAKAAQAGGCSGTRLSGWNANTDLLGFPIKGNVGIYLQGESSCVPVSLELPDAFGGIRGNAVLRADNGRGLHIETLKIEVEKAFIGPVLLEDLLIEYRRNGDEWDGKVSVGIPPFPGGPKIAGEAHFKRGAFVNGLLRVEFFFPGISLDPFAVSYLNYVQGEFGIDPVEVGGEVGIGVLPIPPDAYTFFGRGNLTVTFGDPVTITYTGNGELLGFPVASQTATITTDGLIKGGGNIGLDLPGVSVTGGLDMFVDGESERFGGSVNGRVCVVECFERRVVVSSRGIGVCLPVGGFGYFWGTPITDVDIMLLDCDVTPYQEQAPAARAAQAGGRTFTVSGSPDVVNVRLRGGDGGPPRVAAFVSPAGERLTPGAPSDPAARLATLASGNRTFAGVRAPVAGAWTVELEPDSPPIVGLDSATSLPEPRVSGRVGGSGRRRTLSYRATTGDGLQTTFVETSRSGSTILGTATRSSGTLRFAPGPGPRGRRTIDAVIERNGMPRSRETIASYTAPGPARPARVKGLKLTRRGRTLTARWRRLSGASAYGVRVDLPDGRRLLEVLSGRRTSLTVRNVPRKGRVTVTVTARNAVGRAGPGARARR